MCGIAGILAVRGSPAISRSLLEAMNGRIAHRGPDGAGCHVEPDVGLAHRRLSIIDLETGEQPMFNEDGTVCVVFNGDSDIYVFREPLDRSKGNRHSTDNGKLHPDLLKGRRNGDQMCVNVLDNQISYRKRDGSTTRPGPSPFSAPGRVRYQRLISIRSSSGVMSGFRSFTL